MMFGQLSGWVGMNVVVDRLHAYVNLLLSQTAAKASGIPISVISEGIGHDSEHTTQIYLASLEASTIDDAIDLILKKLK